MKWNVNRLHRSIEIDQIKAMYWNLDVVTRHVVKTHDAVAETEKSAPFTDAEGGNTRPVLRCPDLKHKFHSN